MVAGWTAGLMAGAATLRPVAEALRARGLLLPLVVLALVLSAALAFRLLRREGGDAEVVPWVPLLLVLPAGAWLSTAWALPEERIHLAAYAPLGILAWRAVERRLVPALLLCWTIGAADEALQGFLPGRTFDPRDVAANAVAATAGLALARGGRGSWTAPALLVAARLLAPFWGLGGSGMPGEGPLVLPDGRSVFHADPPRPREPVAPAVDAPFAFAPVLLVTIDALRADHVPPWGRARIPTPAFDRLAKESLTWEQVHAESTWTSPAIVSLLTGLAPAVHGVAGRGLEIAPSIETPLDRLSAAGWTTAGFAGDRTENYRDLGFGQELDREADLVPQAIRLLSADVPAFVWVHLRQIHAPYDATPERLAGLGLPSRLPQAPILDRARGSATVPRADYPGRHGWLREPIRALYAAELADADAELGRLLGALDESGLAGRVVLAVAADHGEELLDHDGIGHASTTLDAAPQPELVEIPLYLRLPDGRSAGRVAAGTFRQTDFMPTLLPLLGLSAPAPAGGVLLDGRDLSAQVLSEAVQASPVPTLVTGAPCGWQCPPERRDERVHARISGHDWQWCRPPAALCTGALAGDLESAERRRRALRTPVPSPR